MLENKSIPLTELGEMIKNGYVSNEDLVRSLSELQEESIILLWILFCSATLLKIKRKKFKFSVIVLNTVPLIKPTFFREIF